MADDDQAILDCGNRQLADQFEIVAHEDQDFRAEAEGLGASGYVLKSNLLTQLAGALRHALSA